MNDMDVILILSFMTAWNILGMNDGKAHENVNEMAFFFFVECQVGSFEIAEECLC